MNVKMIAVMELRQKSKKIRFIYKDSNSSPKSSTRKAVYINSEDESDSSEHDNSKESRPEGNGTLHAVLNQHSSYVRNREAMPGCSSMRKD